MSTLRHVMPLRQDNFPHNINIQYQPHKDEIQTQHHDTTISGIVEETTYSYVPTSVQFVSEIPSGKLNNKNTASCTVDQS